jgi:hypothetical protein
VFLIAQEISHQWPALVFVSLRPETFNRSQKRGALTGYHAKAFTISPPRIDQAILKRLRFALNITTGRIPVSRLQGVGIKLERLSSLVRVLIYSLERDTRLYELLDNLSGGNIRAALVMLTTFIGSGHIDTEKILRSYEKTGDYKIPPHEFIRAVIYGDSEHYDPGRSVIANVFDISSLDRREHFLLPLLIGTLDRAGTTRGADGFVETRFLFESLQNIGFTADQIDFAVSRALDKKLLQMSGRQIQGGSENFATEMRVTPSGLYHAYRLTATFQYLDAMIIDTPILNESVRDKTRATSEIGDRLTRVEVFVKEYLDSAWSLVSKDAVGFDWNEASEAVIQEISEIRWEVATKPKHYPRRGRQHFDQC